MTEYNGLKKRVLELFARSGVWLPPRLIAVEAGFQPLRSAWDYLKRLHRWHLLDRRTDFHGRLAYRITERGRQRLTWLQTKTGKEDTPA